MPTSDLTGTKSIPIYNPPRKGDVKHSVTDISKAKQLLGTNTPMKCAMDWPKQLNGLNDNNKCLIYFRIVEHIKRTARK